MLHFSFFKKLLKETQNDNLRIFCLFDNIAMIIGTFYYSYRCRLSLESLMKLFMVLFVWNLKSSDWERTKSQSDGKEICEFSEQHIWICTDSVKSTNLPDWRVELVAGAAEMQWFTTAHFIQWFSNRTVNTKWEIYCFFPPCWLK